MGLGVGECPTKAESGAEIIKSAVLDPNHNHCSISGIFHTPPITTLNAEADCFSHTNHQHNCLYHLSVGAV